MMGWPGGCRDHGESFPARNFGKGSTHDFCDISVQFVGHPSTDVTRDNGHKREPLPPDRISGINMVESTGMLVSRE